MDSQKQPPAYSQTKDELFSNLETSSAGLSEPEVDRRLKNYGHNVSWFYQFCLDFMK